MNSGHKLFSFLLKHYTDVGGHIRFSEDMLDEVRQSTHKIELFNIIFKHAETIFISTDMIPRCTHDPEGKILIGLFMNHEACGDHTLTEGGIGTIYITFRKHLSTCTMKINYRKITIKQLKIHARPNIVCVGSNATVRTLDKIEPIRWRHRLFAINEAQGLRRQGGRSKLLYHLSSGDLQ